VLIIINSLILRWLYVTRRRLALEKARRRRQAEVARIECRQVEDAGTGEDPGVVEEPEIGIAQINEQTRARLRTLILFAALIVLFERPYRVGDFVTVGQINGTVTRIRIRATTVRDLDRRELIVPNKNFITGELINWSLSDNVLRIIVPVGIAYGSNIALAGELLLKVARQNPEVLSEPEPSALFLGFRDNSLNFELRIFIDDPMKRFRISHQLHTAIDEEFRRAGIVIAFPQRDVHLDQIGRLEVNVVSNPANQPAEIKDTST